jgi:hypothetical protein
MEFPWDSMGEEEKKIAGVNLIGEANPAIDAENDRGLV